MLPAYLTEPDEPIEMEIEEEKKRNDFVSTSSPETLTSSPDKVVKSSVIGK
jgi:hypothetical protein